MRGLLTATLALVVALGSPAVALTLEDLNAPPPSDPFMERMLDVASAGEVLDLALANDDCGLGYSDDELTKMLNFVDLYGGLSRVGDGPVPSELDIDMRGTLWSMKWEGASRAVRLHLCAPMADLTERVRQ